MTAEHTDRARPVAVAEAPITGVNAAQLVDSVRGHIASGRLRPHDALPPIRELAGRLGLNRNTVASAYALLAAAGFVATRRRAGTVVLDVPRLDGEGKVPERGLTDLSSGNPDPSLLPPTAGLLPLDRPATLYGTDPISPGLRQWVAQTMSDHVPTEHRVVLAHGAVDAMTRLLDVHLTRGDAVAIEEPGFLTSVGVVRVHGYVPVPVPVDAEGMTATGLETALRSGARAVVLTSRAQNPTGAAVTEERAEQLRAVLAAHPDVLVIEDDHFAGVSAFPYVRAVPGSSSRWALVRSVSKSLGPDMRLAVVLTDPVTGPRLDAHVGAPAMWVSHILQDLVEAQLRSPTSRALLDSARTTYRARLTALTDALHAERIGAPHSVDGLNVWVTLPHAASGDGAGEGRERRVIDGLAARGWGARGGSDFHTDPAALAALRLTSATLSEDLAPAVARDLGDVLRGLGHDLGGCSTTTTKTTRSDDDRSTT